MVIFVEEGAAILDRSDGWTVVAQRSWLTGPKLIQIELNVTSLPS